jgi:hypothetical protein
MHSWYLRRYPVIVEVPASYTATITAPGGTIYQFVDATFTVSTDVPSPVYTWSVSGGSVISGQGTTSAVIRFSSSGSCSVTCDVTGGGTASDTSPVTVTAFLPNVISNLSFWNDASSLSYVTLDGSNNVSQITGRLGLSRNLAQPTVTRRPPWTASVRNGLGGFALDSVDDFLNASTGSATNYVGSGTETTIITFGSSTGGRFGTTLNTSRTGSTERFQMDAISSNPQMLVNVGGNSATVSLPAIADGSFYLDITRWSSGQKVYVKRRKGAATTDYESSSTLTGTFSSNLGVWVGSGNSNNLQGYRCEILIYNRRITDTECRQLIDYFEAKWGAI